MLLVLHSAWLNKIALVLSLQLLIGLADRPVMAQDASDTASVPIAPRAAETLRVATFNVSMNRGSAGQLKKDLEKGDAQIQAIATVIRAAKPDVILLNEIDYQADVDNAAIFAERYLASQTVDALGGGPWPMPYRFSAPVNTGEPSGLDINGNGKLNEPEDAWGFGKFPGQYGMAILSRYPIDVSRVRTFQKLKWSTMPSARQPRDPDSGQAYYSPETWAQLRLSSKSHWDVPIQTPQGVISIIASHPTPPAFDGPADHNGCRNHDEIRMLCDYIDGPETSYLVDDQGMQGPIAKDRKFVVAGDLNSDPIDGESQKQAIERLLTHRAIAQTAAPTSRGASQMAQRQGGRNSRHKSDAATDTADFFDGAVGNLRVDYVLPSSNLTVAASGVFWPELPADASKRPLIEELNAASDHHLVWVDVR